MSYDALLDGPFAADARVVDPRPAPGRVTLTSRLAPRAAEVQRRATPAATVPRAAADADASWRALFDVLSPVQRRAAAANDAGRDDTRAIAARGVAGAATAIPHAATLETAFGRYGHVVRDVRAHVGGDAADASAAIGAHAYATGQDIAFASAPDLHLAAHEAAHVVQQRAGVSLSSGVGAAGDRYEQHADRVADAVVRGESAESILDEHAAPSGGSGGAVQRQAAPSATTVSVALVGHASPRWEQTHGKDKHALNQHLSADRVAAVEKAVDAALVAALARRGHTAHVAVTSQAIDDDGAIDVSREAHGSDDTIHEAGGDERSDAAPLRRVNITVTVTWHVQDGGGASTTEQVDVPEQCAPDATTDWSVELGVSGSGGEAVGGAFGVGFLINRLTKKKVAFLIGAAGFTAGVSTPGVSLGDATDFTTSRPVRFQDFDWARVRLTEASVGAGVIGYSWAYLSFPGLGANSISVGGLDGGEIGFDAGIFEGVCKLLESPPSADCTPEHTETRDVDVDEAVAFERHRTFDHTVLFATQSARISHQEHAWLEAFADDVAAGYDWDGS